MIVDPKDRADARLIIRSAIGLVILHAVVSRGTPDISAGAMIKGALAAADEFMRESDLDSLL